nr:dihydrodipicolinate synthetase family [uncultured bacterium]
MESPLVIELAKHPNIRGMKDSSGDVKLISETVWNTNPRSFSVVAGRGATLLHTMVAGARGGIIALVCASPKAMVRLYRAYILGDLRKADDLQRIIAPAANAVTSKYGISGLKYAMEIEGFQPGIARRPLLPTTPAQQQDLQQIFRRMNSEISELS